MSISALRQRAQILYNWHRITFRGERVPELNYRVNKPTVSAESFDDEVVIIHFESGNYYSLDAFGARAWEALEAGASREHIMDHVSGRFRATREEIAEKLDSLMEQLLREDLVCQSDTPGSGFSPESSAGDTKLPADAGTLLKFDDMQQLLLLDPIHDVDEAGWPNSGSGNTPSTND